MNFFKKCISYLVNKKITLHIIFWIVFAAYEISLLYFTTKRTDPVYIYFIYYGINILYFYLHASLLNYIFNRPKPIILKGAAMLILSFICYLSFKTFIDCIITNPRSILFEKFFYFERLMAGNLFRSTYFTILSTFYWAAGYISYFKRQAIASEKKQLTIQKDKAELEVKLAESTNAYLMQQINPHMLFNSLNFIYSKVFLQSKDAAKCVSLLTDIMRFSLKESGADGKIPLNEEIDQLKNLLEINRLRYDTPLQLKTDLEGAPEQFRIIPLILFTLTENLFKHGNLRDPGSPANLRLSVDSNGRLDLLIRNLKKSKSNYHQNHSLGLRNVKTRLDYAYADQYNLTIAETEAFYELNLNIKL
ncbi:MAG: hypothetical protein JWR12_2977 [Mucilaginibacter sp.]|nr:hypothetical protein [Mucilaginibacter sp.]